MEPRILVRPDAEALAECAAELIAEHSRAAVAERGGFTVALSGGSTPGPAYERLAATPALDASRWQLFWVDERCVPATSEFSNRRLVPTALLDRLPPGQVHTVPVEAGRPREVARQYAATLRTVFGLDQGQVPTFDLIVLGVGDDGHTASLFPHGPRDAAPGQLVKMTHAGHPPWIDRVTLTFPVLQAARSLLVLVAGAGKAGIVRTAIEGDPRLPGNAFNPKHYPIHALHGAQGEVVWLLDAAAAAELPAARRRS